MNSYSYGDMICLAILIGIVCAACLGTALHFALTWMEQWGFISRDGE